jgi:hypothetical protein
VVFGGARLARSLARHELVSSTAYADGAFTHIYT